MSQLPIPLPLNESRWRYVTASGGGMTVAFLAGSGGSITLLSPEGENVSFRYGGVGGGIGLGMRLPRFGKVNLNVKGKSVGGAGALEALPSTGTVLVADGLVGRDLSAATSPGPACTSNSARESSPAVRARRFSSASIPSCWRRWRWRAPRH